MKLSVSIVQRFSVLAIVFICAFEDSLQASSREEQKEHLFGLFVM